MRRNTAKLLTGSLLLLQITAAQSSEFMPLKTALSKALGTTKAFQKKIGTDNVYYAKDSAGKPTKLAIVQKGLYKPDCTHTWVIGMNANDSTVDQVLVVEMKCPHAFPTNKAFYLDQYKGKGPADVANLKSQVTTVAKATATSNLTTDAVVTAINDAVAFHKEVN